MNLIRLLLKLIFILFSSFLVACSSTHYQITVDTIGSTDNAKLNYVLLPSNKGVSADDLQFREYASYVDTILRHKGYKKVSDRAKADVIVWLFYKISEPKEHSYTSTVPTFGQTGVIGSTTTGTVTSYGGGYGTYTANTTYMPTYGITGSYNITENYVTYMRYISLEAIDAKSFYTSKKIKPIWKTKITSEGQSSDFRSVFPIMLLSVYEQIGSDSNGEVNLEIDKGSSLDKQIINFKKGKIIIE